MAVAWAAFYSDLLVKIFSKVGAKGIVWRPNTKCQYAEVWAMAEPVVGLVVPKWVNLWHDEAPRRPMLQLGAPSLDSLDGKIVVRLYPATIYLLNPDRLMKIFNKLGAQVTKLNPTNPARICNCKPNKRMVKKKVVTGNPFATLRCYWETTSFTRFLG